MFDYTGSKADWAVHGLPMEGRTAGRRRAIEVARRDIATCGPAELASQARDRARGTGHDLAVVVDANRVVLGTIGPEGWDRDPDASAGDVMAGGPPTIKPDSFIHELIDDLRDASRGYLVVTWHGPPDGGQLVGVLFLDDAMQVLAENARLKAEAGG